MYVAAGLLVLGILMTLAVKYVRYGGILKVDVVKHFPFSSERSLDGWKEKIFKGRVLYSVREADHESFVLATSKGTASALFYKVKLDMNKNPVISWKWNVNHFPRKAGKEDLKNASDDDFGARVYVIFPSLLFLNSRAIEYIWAENVKEGVISSSPYSKNLKLMVVESGKKEGGGWVYEERDVYQDYILAFGHKPKKPIGAIAFMTDADSTNSTAEAVYDDIKLGYKRVDKGGEE